VIGLGMDLVGTLQSFVVILFDSHGDQQVS
jgi:hypothetical protein